MTVIPNHVTNKLLFHPCTEQRFNEILADLQKEGAEPGSIDLGRIIPEPEGLFMGDLGVEEMKKYKDNNWYDWRIKHWNTKWNAYGFEPPAFSSDTGTMTFRTANCSPFRVHDEPRPETVPDCRLRQSGRPTRNRPCKELQSKGVRSQYG